MKFSLVVSAVCPLIMLIVSGNYPLYKNYKPCARLKNTVNYQKPICVDNGAGGFEAESERNCKESFRETCPEFNMASCEWITNVSFPNSSVGPTPVPCCRLKYFARHYTWLEIYYTNQYGKNVSVYDIVEIHRRIKNHDSFGKRDQNDWPESVPDPNGERGLTWTIATNLSKALSLSGTAADFCANENDMRCSVDLVQYLSGTYPNGFDDHRIPKTSAKELKNKANVSYSFTSDCRDIWVDAQKTRACQVLYWYNSSYKKPYYKNWRHLNLVFPFLEVQAFVAPSKSESSSLSLRFAYWSQDENPDSREEIFNVYYQENYTTDSD